MIYLNDLYILNYTDQLWSAESTSEHNIDSCQSKDNKNMYAIRTDAQFESVKSSYSLIS